MFRVKFKKVLYGKIAQNMDNAKTLMQTFLAEAFQN
jgi:hypothetical protein